ncbi:MAG TPA: hypothetical protein PLZ43_14480 [bacterium]|nr:hypothetical protein [bacterium]
MKKLNSIVKKVMVAGLFFVIFTGSNLSAESITWEKFKETLPGKDFRASGKIISKTMKYTPVIALVVSGVEMGFVLNEHGFKEAWTRRDFYKDLSLIPVEFVFGTGGAVLFVAVSSPICLAAGTVATPVAGGICAATAGTTGYVFGAKIGKYIHSELFNMLWPESVESNSINIDNRITTR